MSAIVTACYNKITIISFLFRSLRESAARAGRERRMKQNFSILNLFFNFEVREETPVQWKKIYWLKIIY